MIPAERERVEELAEEIWALSEMEANSAERLLGGSKIDGADAVLAAMIDDGLAARRDGRIVLTETGKEIASGVVRRHRLAEMLLTQVLLLPEAVSETTACEMEHILSEEVADSVCSFLGHPAHCPHGKPVPAGRCCEGKRRDVQPIVARLAETEIGAEARIVFIAPHTRKSLEKAAALGVLPGARIRLRQRRPAVVIEAGETTIALDRGIADDIYVRPLPAGEEPG